MRKLGTLFLAVTACVLMGIGIASADDDDSKKKKQKDPDSIVVCEGQEGTFRPININAPAGFSLDVCETAGCSDCIRSLENQGCKVVGTDISPGDAGGDLPPGSSVGGSAGRSDPRVTFLLSCEKP